MYDCLALFTTFHSMAQGTMESCVQQAMESHIAFLERQYKYEQSLVALKEAKRMLFPNLSLEAS